MNKNNSFGSFGSEEEFNKEYLSKSKNYNYEKLTPDQKKVVEETKKRQLKKMKELENTWHHFYPTSTTFPEAPFDEIVRTIALEAAELLIKKHHDYGPDNINNAPGGAMNGLLVRMHDKMERLKTLLLGNKLPKYESIEDTFIDMINYSIIALMVQRGKWPK